MKRLRVLAATLTHREEMKKKKKQFQSATPAGIQVPYKWTKKKTYFSVTYAAMYGITSSVDYF